MSLYSPESTDRGISGNGSNDSKGQSSDGSNDIWNSGPPIGFGEVFCLKLVLFFGGWDLEFYVLLGLRGTRFWKIGLSWLDVIVMGSGLACLFSCGILSDRSDGRKKNCQTENEDLERSPHGNTVTQKLLTSPHYCNTLIIIERSHVANILSIDKQVAIISVLAESSGIRQIERMKDVPRDTIMRLGVRVGRGWATLMDAEMRDLSCDRRGGTSGNRLGGQGR